MKRSIHYVPNKDGQLAAWGANYEQKIALHGPTIGLTADQIAAQQAAARGIVEKFNKAEQRKADLAEAIKAKQLCRSNEIKTICDAVIGYKRFTGFTENIGKDLGVISNGVFVDFSTLRPSLKCTVYPGYVSISFNKQNMYGVTLFSRIKGTEGWTEIGSKRNSPYKDMRPLVESGKPEHREYMAMCYDGEIDLGQQSDIISVVFGG